MQSIYYTKDDDLWCIFIPKRLGDWFQISGRGKVSFSSGRYLDDHQFQKECIRLDSEGYQKRLVSSD